MMFSRQVKSCLLLVISLCLTACNSLPTQPTSIEVKPSQFDYIEIAKINHYPAPATVLALAEQLNLTPMQKQQSQHLQQQTQQHLTKLKMQLQTKQAALKQLFETHQANDDLIAELLAEISIKESKIRYVQLGARIKQQSYLTPRQLSRYMQLYPH